MKKTVIITGGSSGLGKALAKRLVGGHEVVILSHDEEELKETAKEIGCDFFVCDISDENQVETAVEEILKKHDQIDILVNNAGIWIRGELDENSYDEIRRIIEVNTIGQMFMTRSVIPQMKKQKSGTIINVISQDGKIVKERRSVYCASKWAMTGFTGCLEMDLEKYGIKVFGIYPGRMKTKLFEHAGVTNENLSDAQDPDEVAEEITSRFNLDG